MTDPDCLSVLEIVEVLHAADDEQRAHLESCPRCRGLVRSVAAQGPEALRVADAENGEQPIHGRRLSAPLRAYHDAEDSAGRTGELWRVDIDADWSAVVCVIGRTSDGTVVAAPISPEIGMGAEADVIIDDSPLGYEHLVCVWNSGRLDKGQLAEALGRLAQADRELVVDAYRSLTQAGGFLDGRFGAIVDAADPRRVWREAERQRAVRLFAPVNERIDEPEEPGQPAGPTLSEFLEGLLAVEWDRAGLLEASRVDGQHFLAFSQDKLDTQHHSDLPDLVSLFKAVGEGPSTSFEIVRSTLDFKPGGELRAPQRIERLAASSFSHVSKKSRTRDLYRDQLQVDQSEAARRRAAEAYLKAFEITWDES